ncbi:MAG: redoxin domain-containing protein [Acidimicrobiaceae bacterium]|nr:redoxin domain-containing protein [Acidimicrobiaceae bacterium]MBP9054630.1 redoxin domain-containing protein [Ilumatobacteraceae bacterium]MBK9970495.1 redoxin domain-containing protein [Acidimicrobiaceae bacterium]HQY15851.1 redoxin domain-containing protein [Ilumatobacteraceae bacterium]HQY85683.1 redoxin domain-containing protein [Ilumatobacteraceae bacterium]
MCNAEASSVEAAAQRWEGRVDFVGVAWTGDDAAFQAFIDEHELTFPQLSDDPGAVFAHFGVPAQPAFVIVEADGSATTLLGAVDEGSLDDALAAATS